MPVGSRSSSSRSSVTVDQAALQTGGSRRVDGPSPEDSSLAFAGSRRDAALAADTLPGLQRSVKWGIAWYGVGDGWCFACGGFAGHVKVVFGRGTSLEPVPPEAPIGMGKDSRGVDLESVDDIDDRQLASWMQQATAIPGFGKKR